jgi:hypothetical protein
VCLLDESGRAAAFSSKEIGGAQVQARPAPGRELGRPWIVALGVVEQTLR